jgi:hypothetical protein
MIETVADSGNPSVIHDNGGNGFPLSDAVVPIKNLFCVTNIPGKRGVSVNMTVAVSFNQIIKILVCFCSS